jgi:hypothetical protein
VFLRPATPPFVPPLLGYLALNNMLALANDNHIFERLLEMRHEDFSRWLDDIDREGSVT